MFRYIQVLFFIISFNIFCMDVITLSQIIKSKIETRQKKIQEKKFKENPKKETITVLNDHLNLGHAKDLPNIVNNYLGYTFEPIAKFNVFNFKYKAKDFLRRALYFLGYLLCCAHKLDSDDIDELLTNPKLVAIDINTEQLLKIWVQICGPYVDFLYYDLKGNKKANVDNFISCESKIKQIANTPYLIFLDEHKLEIHLNNTEEIFDFEIEKRSLVTLNKDILVIGKANGDLIVYKFNNIK